ncbi:dethiobiotin synthase [Campylobacter avium]|uniref:dethiobiotin synthase n=1 Tax=Campylobacter avium TaxID=522485 RepID=UPI00255B4518|nr:ATP-dependent dethiobiotin synthetase BioD [Campylobacter avium]
MQIYVCGSSTDVGKTHFCAAFCEAFSYEYFKLIQAGENKDSKLITSFAKDVKIHKEGVFLKTPASPHIGKKLEGLDYKAFDIALPDSKNLLIETAGGLFTPIDEKCCMIDYMAYDLKPCILVASYYLGCINHIILSIEALRQRELPLLALVMSGKKDEDIDNFVFKYSGVKIVHLEHFNKENFRQKALALRQDLIRVAKF